MNHITLASEVGRLDLVLHLVDKYEEEWYQEYSDGYGYYHSEEDTGADGLAAGRAWTAGDNHRQHA